VRDRGFLRLMVCSIRVGIPDHARDRVSSGEAGGPRGPGAYSGKDTVEIP
jgi:hypothetical protein